MPDRPATCSNAACRVATEGKCVEGLPLDECLHFGKLSVADIPEAEEPAAFRAEEQPSLALADGEALDRRGASLLRRRSPSRAVAVVGPHEAGKTSLIASLFDLLQEGPVGDYAFAGSSTLVGFDKICHHARASSRRTRPYTERTIVGAPATFFHLDLTRPERPGTTSLLVADRSGEDYLAAADDLSQAADLLELRHAGTVTLLVNGEHLTNAHQRHEVKAVTPQLVGALVEAGAIRPHQRIAVVLTKQDTVEASPDARRAEADFDQIVNAVRARHGASSSGVERFVIAASPESRDKVARGQGVDRLLAYWMRAEGTDRLDPPQPRTLLRSFDSFGAAGEGEP